MNVIAVRPQYSDPNSSMSIKVGTVLDVRKAEAVACIISII